MRLKLRWTSRQTVERQMREEMEFHLESRIAHLVSGGMPAEEAVRTARLEFGSQEAQREECRTALGYRPWDELRSDLRFAVRSIRKHPGYTAAVVGILALAIGVNSAFFILFSHHVLKPLPIRGADRHFDLRGVGSRAQSTPQWTADEVAALRKADSQRIEGLYSARTIQTLVLEPVQRLGMVSFVSGNYFQVLGSNAAAGRTFTEPEQREAVVVLSRSGQRRYFPDAVTPLGKRVRIAKQMFTVIGIMPPEFTGTEPVTPDLWAGAEMFADPDSRGRGEQRYSLSGLLAPGISLSQAEAALTAVASRFPRKPEETIARVVIGRRSGLIAADENFTVIAALLFAASLMVLVVACANLANLCLARAASRTHEIVMRHSLGASRYRIIRQLLTESTLVALLGAVGGIGVGILTMQESQRYLASFAARMGIAMLPISADWRVLFFAGGLGMLAGLAFGLLPAIEVTSPSLVRSAKREQSSFAGRIRPRKMRDILIAGQVAFSFVLLLLAAVLTRHIQGLNVTSPGYDLDRIYDLRLDRPQPATLALLATQPFIASATAVRSVPLYGAMDERSAVVDSQAIRLSYNEVDQRFFETMDLPIEGRGFSAQEAATRAKVTVISRATARRLWPRGALLGRSLKLEDGTYDVIGVVPDVVSGWLFKGKDTSAAYFPAAAGQENIESAMVRIKGSAAAAIAAIRKVCTGAADATGCEPFSLREVSALWRLSFQAAAWTAATLGMLSLVLTAVGLYSVTSYSVVYRRREIGVHMALGGTPAQVIRHIVGEAWRCVLTGLAVGIPISLILSRLINSSVFGIRAFDPGAYAMVPVLLAIIATVACSIPARRAMRADPMTLLKED